MSLFIKTILSPKPFSLCLFGPQTVAHRHFSLLSIFGPTRRGSNHAQTQTRNAEPEAKPNPKPRKPLDILFKEAVGIYPKPDISDDDNAREGDGNVVKRGLRGLERELRSFRAKGFENVDENRPKGLFTNRVRRDGERNASASCNNPMVFEEISADMKLFVSLLDKEGYLNDASFLTNYGSGCGGDGLDFGCFDNSFGRGFIKFAAEKFAKDKQEIAKWLSGSDLKTVALFGCPSLGKRSIFAAKRLRKFFEVQEDTVCSKCTLKQSCKFVNQNVWKTDTKKLVLIDVINVITQYALESVPSQLLVPDEIKASVSRLLNEVVKLSQTTS